MGLFPDKAEHGLGILVAAGSVLAQVLQHIVTAFLVADGTQQPLLGLGLVGIDPLSLEISLADGVLAVGIFLFGSLHEQLEGVLAVFGNTLAVLVALA